VGGTSLEGGGGALPQQSEELEVATCKARAAAIHCSQCTDWLVGWLVGWCG
jgi:hypothetical protein